jgi:hypothetical protein
MGVLNSGRAVIFCGAKSWKLASISSINTRSLFSSSLGTAKDKGQNDTCSPSLSQKNVSLLKSAILKVRFNSSGVSEQKSTGFFSPDAAIDKTGNVKRWSMFVPAFLTHLCKYTIFSRIWTAENYVTNTHTPALIKLSRI